MTPLHIEAWLTEQLTSGGIPCIGIAELTTTATKARIRAGVTQLLRTRAGDAELVARIEEGDAWLVGPIVETPSQPPLRLTIHHDLNELDLTIGVEWSWWSEGPGRADLDAAIGRMLDGGWTRRS